MVQDNVMVHSCQTCYIDFKSLSAILTHREDFLLNDKSRFCIFWQQFVVLLTLAETPMNRFLTSCGALSSSGMCLLQGPLQALQSGRVTACRQAGAGQKTFPQLVILQLLAFMSQQKMQCSQKGFKLIVGSLFFLLLVELRGLFLNLYLRVLSLNYNAE